MFSFLPEVVF